MTKAAKTNLLSLLVGVALFAGLLYWIRASTVLTHLSRVGPWIFAIIAGYGVAQFCFVLAWRALLPPDTESVSLRRLFRAYLAGDAVNYLVVSGNLAGEPLKAHLLRPQVPMVQGLSSVTINKLSEAVSMILFQTLGIFLAFYYHVMTPEMAWGCLLVFCVMTVAIGLFFWRQKQGLFGWIFRGLSKTGVARSFFEKTSAKAETLDNEISGFYETGGSRFRLSLLFNFLGWTGGAVEAYFLLKLLGVQATFPMVFTVEAISILANNVFFFIPARLGGGDGAKVLVFLSMGLSSALGLSFGLLRRAREIFYAGLGFLFLVQLNPFRRQEAAAEGTLADRREEALTMGGKENSGNVLPPNRSITVTQSSFDKEKRERPAAPLEERTPVIPRKAAWPPKACLLDFGGTIDADGETWQDRFFSLYVKHGIEVDREAFRKAFYFADDTLTESLALEGQGIRKTLEAQVEKVWNALHLENGRGTREAIVEDFLQDMRRTVDRNRAVLERLRSRCLLGIVSNFYGNLETVCSDLGIRDLFDCIVDSARVGATKPDPRIFHAALDRMGVAPEEAVYIGDNPFRDMEGAKGVGMPHIWLVGRTDRDDLTPCCPGDPVIRSLEEVPDLILVPDGKAQARTIG